MIHTMSDEFVEWTAEDRLEAFDAAINALCDCSPGGPCNVCDTLCYGGDLSQALVERIEWLKEIYYKTSKDYFRIRDILRKIPGHESDN